MNYEVLGTIPYGSADTVFPTAGNRFAIKIKNSAITSRNNLPNGNILKTTNINAQGGYNVSTKTAFEDDGSLIVVFAPTESTLNVVREVKIAWTIAGSSVAESDYTVYKFDLDSVTLAQPTV